MKRGLEVIILVLASIITGIIGGLQSYTDAKVFKINFQSKADCPMKKVCPYDNIKESKKKGDNNAK